MNMWLTDLNFAIAWLMCIGAGTVGGVFFAFSTFVMSALAQLPVAHGIGAMQRINVAVINPCFLGAFFGSALLAAACVAIGLISSTGQHLLLAAGLTYLAGSFGVTIVCNVPRNERLARLDASSAEGVTYWNAYVHEWTGWNHVRAAAAIISSACAAATLVPS